MLPRGTGSPARIMCVNCNICFNNNTMRRYHVLELDTRVTSIICNWIHPQIISEDHYVCEACRDLAIRQVNDNLAEASDNQQAGPSHRGHCSVCLLCGSSILRRQSDMILQDNPSDLHLSMIEIIQSRVAPRQNMPRLEQSPPEDFRRVLREKALSHSLFYLKLGAGVRSGRERDCGASVKPTDTDRADVEVDSAPARAPVTARVSRHAQPRVSELLRRFEPGPMQYLRIPRAATPPDDITSSDDDDRAAVRRRSRDLSDDSAVELEPRRRHSHHVAPAETMSPRRERTLVEAHVVELGRRGSEGCETRGRCVRTPSVVVSDYSDGVAVGATAEEVDWLRARSLSADSACSSCSTLSSRDDDEFESPTLPKKINSD